MAIITEDVDESNDGYLGESSSSPSSKLDNLIHHSRDRIAAHSLDSLLDGVVTSQDIALKLLVTSTNLLQSGDASLVDLRKIERVEQLFGLLDDAAFNGAAIASHLRSFVQAVGNVLVIPYTFTLPHFDITPQISQQLSYWRAGADAVISILETLFKCFGLAQHIFDSMDETASLVNTLARFTGIPLGTPDKDKGKEDIWTSAITAAKASKVINILVTSEHDARLDTAKFILLKRLKPMFSATPHVQIHPETGRKLPRPLGGDLFEPDYGDSVWKGKSQTDAQSGAIGCWRVYQFVLTMIKPEDMENVWPMLIPPLMTMLDDHEPYYRLAGIQSVSVFLDIVPPQLLMRTGLHDLILTSISSTFVYTSDSANISMIKAAIFAYLLYIDRFYPASDAALPAQAAFLPLTTERHRLKKPVENPSAIRFRLLCSLYQSVVTNLFAFSSNSIPFTTLALQNIPLIVDKMKRGCIRYLGDTLPMLCSILGGSPAARTLGSRLWTEEIIQQLVAAADALDAIIKECTGTGRMDRWSGMILSAVATGWVNIHEDDSRLGVDATPLAKALKRLVRSIRIDGGTNADADLQRIMVLDTSLFSGLSDDC